MSDPVVTAKAKQLTQVAGLATSVADRILDAQIAGRPIPPEHLTSLVGAARLLQDHGMDWPPLVEQVLHEFADRIGEREASAAPETDDGVVAGLSRFLGAFRREKAGDGVASA